VWSDIVAERDTNKSEMTTLTYNIESVITSRLTQFNKGHGMEISKIIHSALTRKDSFNEHHDRRLCAQQ
jgi:hypothetical protein